VRNILRFDYITDTLLILERFGVHAHPATHTHAVPLGHKSSVDGCCGESGEPVDQKAPCRFASHSRAGCTQAATITLLGGTRLLLVLNVGGIEVYSEASPKCKHAGRQSLETNDRCS
jgi:hypothetical protein